MREFFLPDAYINWHDTNEHFTVEEYIHANMFSAFLNFAQKTNLHIMGCKKEI